MTSGARPVLFGSTRCFKNTLYNHTLINSVTTALVEVIGIPAWLSRCQEICSARVVGLPPASSTHSPSQYMSTIASEKSYLDMKSFALHRKCRRNQADIGSYSCNDQLLLPCVPNSCCKSWIVPCIDNSFSLDALIVRLGRGLSDHAQEQALYIGFPKALPVSSKRWFKNSK